MEVRSPGKIWRGWGGPPARSFLTWPGKRYSLTICTWGDLFATPEIDRVHRYILLYYTVLMRTIIDRMAQVAIIRLEFGVFIKDIRISADSSKLPIHLYQEIQNMMGKGQK